MATGPAHQSVPTDVEVKPESSDKHLALTTGFSTNPKHKAAGERMSEDKYSNLCVLDDNVDTDQHGVENVYEYAENSKYPSVKGRLRARVNFWKVIGASQFVIDIISRGYIIPFLTTPPRMGFQNNRSAFENSEFVDGAIRDLIIAGAIVQCKSPPTVVNPLSVATQSCGKKRLILDLRYPNSFLKKFKIKFEGVQEMLTTLRDSQQNFLFSFDIKSAYHHIDIFPCDQQFLGFSWKVQGVIKYYKFTVLPFGLATAPYIFTKIVRPLVKHWRTMAHKIIVYLDDGLGAAQSFSSCLTQASRVRDDIASSGFVASVEKCIWVPTQCLTWLGLDWNLTTQTLSVPPRKIEKVLNFIKKTLVSKKIKARQLASLTGLIMSNLTVFGVICKLMTKALHSQINSRFGWDSLLTLSTESIRELTFWENSVVKLNSRSLRPKPSRYTRVVYSDASNTGCAAFVSLDDTPIFHRNWNELEMKQSSTWRELLCIRDALRSLAPSLQNNNVKWYTDNQGVVSIVDSGSMKLHLHQLALDIFYSAKDNNIEINIEWIPRALNDIADYLSKIIDPDDWHVKDSYFKLAQSQWGTCSIDCFANCQNSKTKRFYSKFFNPNSLGVDCFAFNWSGEFCWLVPPIKLIPKTVKHVCLSGCRAILTVPFWPSAVFWPLLINENGNFRPFVSDYVYIENGKDVFEQGLNKLSLFGSDEFASPVLFLLLDAQDSLSA